MRTRGRERDEVTYSLIHCHRFHTFNPRYNITYVAYSPARRFTCLYVKNYKRRIKWIELKRVTESNETGAIILSYRERGESVMCGRRIRLALPYFMGLPSKYREMFDTHARFYNLGR